MSAGQHVDWVMAAKKEELQHLTRVDTVARQSVPLEQRVGFSSILCYKGWCVVCDVCVCVCALVCVRV